MENLNDVEFGSDNDGKEAPILVAQRYLNIFRQVHIFNKNKREEFDNELLALPPEITDFFKRMPGGRLLVEHIEKVKTERGISFVKANREDFDEGAGKIDAPAPVQAAGGAVIGGSLTIDSSFAEALAKALALAFKQNQVPVSAGETAVLSSGAENAFDVIAEEIRSSRAAMLDVLKETRSVTDSVIASQVSIARILEGILSSRNRDDADLSDLNNRIIASQASITKLLEGLYTSNNKKNTEISDYLNVENRLQTFRNEIKNELDASLRAMQDMFKEYAQTVNDKKIVIDASPLLNTFSESAQRQDTLSGNNAPTPKPSRPEQDAKEHQTESANKYSQVLPSAEEYSPVSHIAGLADDDGVSEGEDDVSFPEGNMLHFEPVAQFTGEPRKKKKKKKKHHGNADTAVSSANGFPTGSEQPANAVSDIKRENIPTSRPAEGMEIPAAKKIEPAVTPATATGTAATVSQSPIPQFDGVIRNQEFKHNDDFNNIRLDVPPSDTLPEEEHISAVAQQEKIFAENFSTTDNPVSDTFANIPETDEQEDSQLLQSLDSLDALNFEDEEAPSQPEIQDAVKATSDADTPDLTDFASNDDEDLDFELPQHIYDTKEEANLSPATEPVLQDFNDIQEDDDLDFALPETSAPDAGEDNHQIPSLSFDDIQGQDIPVETSAVQRTPTDMQEQSHEIFDDTPMQSPKASENMDEQHEIDEPSLDDFLNGGNTGEPIANIPDGPELSTADSADVLPTEISDYQTESPVRADDIEPTQDIRENSPDTFDDLQQFLTVPEENNEPPFSQTVAPNVEPISTVVNEPFADNMSADASAALAESAAEKNIRQEEEPALDGIGDVSVDITGQAANNGAEGTMTQDAPADIPATPVSEEKPSRYSAELDRIRAALTTDNIDISSLDQPIELDDYDDDENVGQHDYADINPTSEFPPSTNAGATAPVSSDTNSSSSADASGEASDEDWEWEYVDEDGNEVPSDDEDWEWEYVEDDGTTDEKPDNNQH